MGFTREQLKAFEGKTVPDLLSPDVRLLFVGINPGLWTTDVTALVPLFSVWTDSTVADGGPRNVRF